ncbi:MAG: invasion associated locus B family protein [Cohaesibacter sp.]|jgi:invasion protein IalB|nr:invasion associated locus B family protein [Cohaesibacter sp.]
MRNLFLKALAAALLSVSFSSSSLAQSDIAPVPTSSVETYGAWKLQCSHIAQKVKEKEGDKKAGKKAAKKVAKDTVRTVCEVVQPYSNRKTGNEIARLVFAKNTDGKKGVRAILRTLVDLSFKNQPVLMDDKAELAKGEFQNCAGQFCYITFTIDKEARKKIAAAKALNFQFPLARGNNIKIQAEEAGLSDALNALESK